MDTLYITGDGLQLKRRSERIVVRSSGKVIAEHPFYKLKRVLIIGNSQATTDLLTQLSKRGIDVAYLTNRGRLKFRLASGYSKNIYLRLAQYEKFRDRDICLKLAKIVVQSKVKNQRALLRRYKHYLNSRSLKESLTVLERYIRKSQQLASIDSLRGLEGRATKIYFGVFGSLLKNGFVFSGRKYHPSPDPVNALLSFGYTLVTNELVSMLEAHGFDPYIGFFHQIAYGRISLAVDLIEQFRAPLVDRLVLYIINKKVIKPGEFANGKNGDVRMSNRALKAYLSNYEQFVTSSFKDKQSSKRMTYRKIFKRQVLDLEKCLLHDVEYRPYLFY